MVGCFAAASRFNGVLQNDLEITALLHMHGALAFWDYSTAAPNCVINMNPEVSSSSFFMQNGNLSIFGIDPEENVKVKYFILELDMIFRFQMTKKGSIRRILSFFLEITLSGECKRAVSQWSKAHC